MCLMRLSELANQGPDRYVNLVGIDIADEDFQVSVRTTSGFDTGKFGNEAKHFSKLAKWLEKRVVEHPHLIMEATGRYWRDLAKWAVAQGWKVTVVNPRQSREYASSRLQYNKTDKIDANVLLRFGESAELGELRLWTPPSQAREELEEIHMLLLATKKMITQERNRLKSGLTSKWVKEQIGETLESLNARKKLLQKKAKSIVLSDEKLSKTYKQLMTVIGLGEATVITLIAKIDFDQFEKGRQLVALAGLVPRVWESGKSIKKRAAISRVGHSCLRSALYFPAISAMNHDPGMAEYVEKLKRVGKPKKVIICAVMSKLLLTAFAVLRDDRAYEVRTSALAA